MFTIRPACRLEHAVLLDIWLRSVRATHTFLSEQDIQSLLPVVRDQALERRLKGSLTVDVNEQNPAALQFYRANGFTVTGRSALDAGGRPFPLLHLREIGEAATVSGSVEASC